MVLQFSYHSAGYLAGSLLSTGLFLYLVHLRSKSAQTWNLAVYFLLNVCLTAGFVVRSGVWDPALAKPASYVIALYTAFSNVALLRFAYGFPDRTATRESRVAVGALFTLGLLGYGYYVSSSIAAPVYYNFETQFFQFQSPDSARPMGLLLLVSFLWVLAVIVRHCIWEEKRYRASRKSAQAGEAPFSFSYFRLYSREARALRAFGAAVLLNFCFSLSYVLYTTRVIAYTDFQFVLSAAVCIQLFLYALIYLNHSPQPTSFMVRLVGVAVITIILVLGLVNRIVFNKNEQAYDSARRAAIAQMRGLLAAGKWDLIDRGEVAYITAVQGQRRAYAILFASSDEVTPTRLVDSDGLGAALHAGTFGASAVTVAGAVPPRAYRGLSPTTRASFFVRYDLEAGGQRFEVGYPYATYRESVHAVSLQMSVLLVGTSCLLLVAYPFFFYSGLVRPLKDLLVGLRRVNGGDYEVRVEVRSEDEIGFLTRSFNSMVASIRETSGQLRESAARLSASVRDLTGLSTAYQRLVPEQFVQMLGKNSVTEIVLGDAVSREMTVFFADIRGFTELSERMTPDENFRFLNGLLSRVAPTIREHHGFTDKYMGDALMALFSRQSSDALDAAISMRGMLAVYNRDRSAKDRQQIRVGIGINTGRLILGMIGEPERMQGTVISDAVNLASRVEGLTKVYGASILITEQTLFNLEDPTRYHYRLLDRVKVKGRREPVSVFEVYDGDGREQFNLKRSTSDEFERGLQEYMDRRFESAQVLFASVLKANPRDKAAYLYMIRALYNEKHGVPPDWQGIEQMEMK